MASFHKQSPNPAKKNGGQLHVTDLENDVLNYNYRTLLEDLEILHAKGAKDETMKRLSIMLSMLEEDTTRTPDINRAYRRMDFFFETYWEPCHMVNSQVLFVYKCMGLMHLNFDNKDKALKFWQTAFELCKGYLGMYKTTREIEDTLKLTVDKYCHLLIALDYGLDMALEHLGQLHDVYESKSLPKDANLGTILTIKAELLMLAHKYNEALKLSRKGLKMIREGSDNIKKVKSNNAEVLQHYSVYAAMGAELPDFLKPSNDKLEEYEIRALTNIGFAHDSLQNYKLAVQVYDKVLDRTRDLNDFDPRVIDKRKAHIRVLFAKSKCLMKPDCGIENAIPMALESFQLVQCNIQQRCSNTDLKQEKDMKALLEESKKYTMECVNSLPKGSCSKVSRVIKKTVKTDIYEVADELFENVNKTYKANTMKPKEAVEMLDKVERYKSQSKKGMTNPDWVKIGFLRGMVYKRLHKYGNAFNDFQKSLNAMKPRPKLTMAERKNRIRLMTCAALCSMKFGYIEDSIDLYNEALECGSLPESDVDSLVNLAHCHMGLKDYEKGIELLAQAQIKEQKKPSSGSYKEMSLQLRIRDAFGLIHYELKNYETALAYFRGISSDLDLSGNNQEPEALATYHYHYGKCLRKLGKLKDSIGEFNNSKLTAMRITTYENGHPVIRLSHITQSLANVECGQENEFVRLILRCIIRDSGHEFEFYNLGPILQMSEEQDERDFFRHVNRLVFEEPRKQWKLDQDETKRLIKLRISKREFKQFENSCKVNRFFQRTQKAIRPCGVLGQR